jgi:hypothetical protein
LKKLTKGEPITYIEKIYSAYETQFNNGVTNKKIFDKAIAKMGKLQCLVKRWGDEVLQEAGVADEWNEVEDIRRRVCTVISYLEEMLCEVMVDPKGLIVAHHSHCLSYQTKS